MTNKTLTADDFSGNVTINFEDGSFVFFRGAFLVKEEEHIKVYTEHCGYHTYYRASITYFDGEEK